jgi:taurine dioxygenase
MEIRRIAGALGAEIQEVDLASAGEDEIKLIRKTWLEHLVVFFRGQDLSPEQFMAFAKRIGKPVEYPFVKGIAGFPEIIEVKKLEHEKVNFGGVWHSDTAYLEQPPMASMLLAREVPPTGGDTLFANMYLAYETLSDGMKRILDGLVAVNDSAKANVTRTREDRIKTDGGDSVGKALVAEHPVVRTHPETGRKALYVNHGPHGALQRHDRRRERAAARLSLPAPDPPRVHLPLLLAAGIDRDVGQPLLAAQPGQRLPRLPAIMHRITLAGDKPR